MKNKTFKALIAVIVVQIVVFVGMSAYSIASINALKDAEEYKMKIEPDVMVSNVVHYDVVSGLFYVDYIDHKNEYALIDISDGYAYFDDYVHRKPELRPYIEINKVNSKRLQNYEINNVEGVPYYSFNNATFENAYITFKVYNGNVEVTGMYIADVPIEEWLAEPITKPTDIDDENLLEDDLLLDGSLL